MNRWIILSSIILSMFSACAIDSPPDAPDTPAGAPTPTRDISEADSRGHDDISDTLRAAYIQSAQAEATPAYAISPAKGVWASSLRAANPAHGFTSEFTPKGVSVNHEGAAAAHHVAMELSRYGCEQDLSPAPIAAPESSGNRVAYQRFDKTQGGLVEWYVNGPLGLEQGFSLPSAPTCSGTGKGKVKIELAIQGDLAPRVVEAGKALHLVDGSGAVVMRYADLYVRDAKGAAIPAEVEAHDDGISILVDDRGAAYPLEVDPLITTQQMKLFASDAGTASGFGYAVALSGDTAVIGTAASTSQRGAAYVFARQGTGWYQQAKLQPTDSQPGDGFGYAVAIDGDTLVVGQLRFGVTTAAYVFTRTGTLWSQQKKLAPVPAADGVFGTAVAISGGTIVVGGSYSSTYVFVRSGATWVQQAKISNSQPSNQISVAISGNTLALGIRNCDDGHAAPCQVDVHTRSNGVWTKQATLYPPVGPRPHFRFGGSLSLDQDTLAVGTFVYNDYGPDRDAAVVFVRSGGTWLPQATLFAEDAETPGVGGGNFPSSAVSGNMLVISDHRGGGTPPRVFKRANGVWSPQIRIQSALPIELWDIKVALSGSTVLFGTPTDTARGPEAGAAHVLKLQNLVILQRGVLGSVADARVRADKPDTNDGSFTALNAGITTNPSEGGPRRFLLQFDLSAIPTDATITAATLTLTSTGSTAATALEVHNVTTPWTEDTVTWNNAFRAVDPRPLVSFSNGGAGYVGPLDIDLTQAVAAWHSGALTNYGIEVTESGTSPGVSVFASSEAQLALRPRLSITYTQGP